MRAITSHRWLLLVFGATALVFVATAIYLYGFAFDAWIESDAAVTVVLAQKALHAHSPIVTNWYYANGDVWLIAPHLLALVPVAIAGVGVGTLLFAVVTGFLLELYAYSRIYAYLCGERWLGVFGAIVTMLAWSRSHVAFGYIQLGYTFSTCLCMVTFAVFASLTVESRSRAWRWVLACSVLSLIALQNPTRTFAYIYAPIVAGCLWPWRGVSVRRRLVVASTATLGIAAAFVVYGHLLVRTVAWSSPRGHLDFHVIHSVDELVHNVSFLARGIIGMCGGGATASVLSIPGLLVLSGAMALVLREVLASRALDPMRFVCVAVVAQLGVVMVPVVSGNLLVDISSVRYLMPSLLAMLGLGALLAVRALAESGSAWRKLAIGWLVAVPLTASLALRDTPPPTPAPGVWPDSLELERLVPEIVKRGLTRGYADVLAATLLTAATDEAAKVCPVHYVNLVFPSRWLTHTDCYDPANLPDRYFFVVDKHTRGGREALNATFPPAIETFSVGDTYEVHVFRKADTSQHWMELPLPDNDKRAFPLRIEAAHLQMKRGKATLDGERLVATGEVGPIVYGPYITLPRGRYKVKWFGTGIPSPGEIKFYVSADGKEKLAEISTLAANLPTTRGPLGELVFKLPAPRRAIELVAYSQDGGRVVLDEVVIERR